MCRYCRKIAVARGKQTAAIVIVQSSKLMVVARFSHSPEITDQIAAIFSEAP